MRNVDSLWVNANVVQFVKNKVIHRANYFIAVEAGKIVEIGQMAQAKNYTAQHITDVKQQLLLPGLIDCHTHLVYAGSRADEFTQRLEGKNYAEIAAAGGGIISTIKQTREASFSQLFASAEKRLLAAMQQGVTTIEIKSGYGLDLETELMMLRVIKALDDKYPIHIEATFLGTHALPPEYTNRADAYIDYVCQVMLPAVAAENLATSVDAYCEYLAFSVEQCERVFKQAKALGLQVKLHAEQFSDIGGSQLTARYQGLSVDHLEYSNEISVQAIADSSMVAVLLPGAFYFLRETQLPPIDLLRQYDVPMAIATDINPGTSPLNSLPMMMNMASVLYKMKPDEVIMGVTIYASQALGLNNKGRLEVGMDADFSIWDTLQPNELVYEFLPNRFSYSVIAGKIVDV